MKILIIEDEKLLADSIKTLLESKGFDSRELLACINALLRRNGKQIDKLAFGNTAWI